MTRFDNRGQLLEYQQQLKRSWDPKKRRIFVCLGTGCKACGGQEVAEAFQSELARRDMQQAVEIIVTGCHGFCENGPLVIVQPEGVLYTRVEPKDVKELVEETLLQGRIVEKKLYHEVARDGSKRPVIKEEDVPFYKNQMRLLLGLNQKISPTNIDHYLMYDGYSALARALFEMKPQQVIDQMIKSGLRGRGGGGFPTGLKWKLCREAPGDGKYIICNADEGDPGAFMDRSILEGNPHAVLEGMCIGAYAIGAAEGYIYVRAEYPLAVERFRRAIAQAQEYGLLGSSILGSGFSFAVRVKEGAGAFVCGEETGLMASIEGRRGMPRPRPPFPAQKGLFGKPTNINNVETWAAVPLIIFKGADWFASLGTENSKGTKIFSLVGKVQNTGLVEVPMGMTMRQLVENIGGGVKGRGGLKAVQTGGPAGGCIPERLMDLQIDFEQLARAGSLMGSGGMVVMDEGTCMVDVARYFLAFTQNESCGKCTPCRIGTRQMLTILENICAGRGRPQDVDMLDKLGETVKKASLCGLGQTAPNPVLTTIRYFREEFEEHIHQKKCRAKVCRPLLRFSVIAEKCNGCTLCLKRCPSGAVIGEKKKPHVIVQNKCTQCGICLDSCRQEAVLVE